MKAKQKDEAISSMRVEAIRLIELQQELLAEIKMKIPAAILKTGEQRADQSHAKFTPKAIERKIAELKENRIKVDKLDMVLAVVGTMKAGKSTCINAIVGREILPNRNRPMTALPTIIRHVPGVVTPVLHFTEKQQEPIQKLLLVLRKKLVNVDIDGFPKIAAVKDLAVLAEEIRTNFKLETRYEGEEGIFNFLKSLNDLVRLSTELRTDFPFKSYTSVADFPSIDVEFFHLKQTDSSNELGSFALLDTPGFNEAGQFENLMPMLQDQLSKATAVLAVLDYTQLKSQSEQELRDELVAIAEHSGDRMFALVNKFDAKNANSDDETQTRQYVAKNLLDQVFHKNANIETRIFPVSGQLAFLVKRAELTLDSQSDLGWRDGQPESWIDTFGEKAFGTRYKKDINNREEVLKACADLWTSSLFNAPLVYAIKYSHDNAAQMAIQAATDKLNEIALGSQGSDIADGIGSMLDMRLQGLQTTSEQLEQLVAELTSGIKKLKSKETQANEKLDNLLDGTKHRIKLSLEKASKDALNTVKQNLQGSGSVQNDADNSNSDSTNGFFSSIFKILGSAEDNSKPTKAASKKSSTQNLKLDVEDIMSFSSAADARSKLKEVADTIKDYLEETAVSISKKIDEAALEFNSELETFQNEVSDEVAEFKGHADSAGFGEIKLKVPKIKRYKPQARGDVELSSIIKDKSYAVTKRREQSGGWGWLKRKVDFFDAGWGNDDYISTVSQFEFSKDDLIAHYKKFVTNYTNELKEAVQTSFSEPLEANKSEFFNQMNSAFESIRESMESSRIDQLRSKEQQAQTKVDIEKLKYRYMDSVEEIKELARNVKKLSAIGEDA
jgi:GTPase SAR1 family protein